MVHALTGIRFRLPEGLGITSVKISGVCNAGTLNLSVPSAWSSQGGTATYELTDLSLGAGLRADTAHPGYNVSDDDKILLLMPQS